MRRKQCHSQGLFVGIHVEYCTILSELGQLVQITWTTGFQFPLGAGIFVSTTSTGQATELPTSCPICCEDSSLKDDAADREADHLPQLSGGFFKYSPVLEAECLLYYQ